MSRKIIIIVGIIIMLLFVGVITPTESADEIENYNKTQIVEEYGADMDSALFLFPDDMETMLESTFEAKMKSGLFDTDGYIILKARYNKEDYEAEVARIANTKCSVMGIEAEVRYDIESYALPAYVAVDGFDYVYEYALVNEANCEVTYVLLSYSESLELGKYQECLKLDMSQYEIEDVLKQFTIYACESENGVYVEYTD